MTVKSGRELTIARGSLALTIAVALLGAALGQKASATPAYAKKEKKQCSFCHVNPQGGGKRTDAGVYYKAHNHSLVGYKPAGAAAAVTAPAKPAPKPPKKK